MEEKKRKFNFDDVKVFFIAFTLVFCLCILSASIILGIKYAPELNKDNDLNVAYAEWEQGSLDNNYFEFNQLIKNGNFVDSTYWNVSNTSRIDYSFENNSCVCSVLSDTYKGRISQNISNIIVGHNYLFLLDYYGSYSVVSNCQFILRYGSNATAFNFTGVNDTLIHYSCFFNAEHSYRSLDFFTTSLTQPGVVVGDYCIYKNAMLFDLTSIYGSGNEPTTLEQFKQDFPLDYYNYTLGTIWNNYDSLHAYQNGYDSGYENGYAHIESDYNVLQQSYNDLLTSIEYAPYVTSNITNLINLWPNDTIISINNLAYYVSSSSSGIPQVVLDLGSFLRSGASVKLAWDTIFSTDSTSSEERYGVEVYSLNNSGNKILLYTINTSNLYNSDFEVLLPQDTYTLWFEPISDPMKCLAFGTFRLYTREYDLITLTEDAFQRGADSVDVADITARAMEQGRLLGEKEGFSRGLASANDYTFINLLGSVVDAPLIAVFGKYNSVTKQREGGMLNFSILGTDLTNFVLAMLSLSIILLVIKFALGRSDK